MNDLKLTATREAVLRAVGRGDVTRIVSFRTDRPDRDIHVWAPGATRNVHREIAWLLNAGLVTRRLETGTLSTRWALTEAGEQWLAAHEAAV